MNGRDGNGRDKPPPRPGMWTRRRRRFVSLLQVGVGLKRWAVVGVVGVAIWSIGFAWLIRQFFDLKFPNFLPWYLEGFLFLIVGSGSILAALWGFYRKLSPVLLGSQSIENMADQIYNRWSRGRGPKIVAIGGGTGLSVLLRGLRVHTDNLTAIITVADDGGSSGRLRRELGVLPPGDFRNCLVAMSEDESLLGELFQYRFDEGDGLKGHSFGN
ncbi:MAG: YvcK family protein, partial [SAR202 cluster bacterium]|nr:YvcK family protein [SAR202 cluster bacterium]